MRRTSSCRRRNGPPMIAASLESSTRPHSRRFCALASIPTSVLSLADQLAESEAQREFNRADLSLAKSLLTRYRNEHKEELATVAHVDGDGRIRHPTHANPTSTHACARTHRRAPPCSGLQTAENV
jgi:hypothetical protein